MTISTSRDFELSTEPLWSMPQSVRERNAFGPDKSDYRSFQISSLYCAMNFLLLVIFGFIAATTGEIAHASVLLSLAGLILLGYTTILLGGWFALAKYFTTATMATLCLYLFYTGGIQNNGPLYYFIFPSAALFLNGRLGGTIWVVLLLFMTLTLWNGMFGFDVNRYSDVFVTRLIVVCLMITLLSCIPEYFRLEAERKLMLSYSDLESMAYGDARTGLANRSLLEKLLQLEFNRHQRYGSVCSLMFFEANPVSTPGASAEYSNERLLTLIADLFRAKLRVQDIAGRWEKNSFLLILPEIDLDEANQLAQRLLKELRHKGLTLSKNPVPLTASIGVAMLDKSSLQQVLERASNSLVAQKRKAREAS